MLLKQLEAGGLIPVIKLNDPAHAVPLARALRAGGLNCVEITFRTATAGVAIQAILQEYPDMLVGAGTVVTSQQLSEAREMGARFVVSPGLNARLVSQALEMELTVLPGVVTPSELMMGLSLGLRVFKFFPAETFGGLKAVKALGAPFSDVRFVPTGGIDEGNAAGYWQCDRVLAVGGSWVATETLIDNGHFEEITQRVQKALALMRSVRRGQTC